MSAARPALAVALETSTRAPSVAVRRANGEVHSRSLAGERMHAGDLLPTLAELLAELGVHARDITAVLVGTGPGSYTGLRVGIAAALGLARGAGAALRGVPSGETLAWEHCAPGERCVHLLDARQGELYYAEYERTADEVRVLDGPRVTRVLELPPKVPILGDATVADAARLSPADRARLDPTATPSSSALLHLGLRRLARHGPCAPANLRPLYLRPFRGIERRR
jgi:tRNA threonylcarbamoyladenosine biosynthesis protein TsaB